MCHKRPKLLEMRRRLLLLWLLLAPLPAARALVTPFSHRFRLEASPRVPSAANQSVTYQGVAAGAGGYNGGALAALMRWNTFSLVSEFGLERGGRMTIELSRVESSDANVPVVLTLYDDDQWRVYSLLRLREMPLRSPAVLCHYPSSVRFAVTPARFDGSWRRKFDVSKPSLYTLQAQVCGDATVEIEGTVTMVNVGYDDKLSEYLAVEDLGLIPLYQALIVLYSIATLLWIVECYKHRRNAPKICYAVQIALHIKTVSVTLQLWYLRELSVSGRHEPFLDTAQRLSDSTSNGSLLGVALVGALGWSLTREALSIRERRMLGLVFTVYAAIAVSKSLCYDEDSDACRALMLVEYVIQSILMLTVVIALNFTVAQLRLTLTEARWNNFATPLTYMKLNQFQSFRNLFLVYLLFPTAFLILNLVVVTPPGLWRYDWVNSLISEAATLFMYVQIARVVRPLDPYIYTRVARGTDMRTSREHAPTRSPQRRPSPIFAAPPLSPTIVPPTAFDTEIMRTDSPPGSILELNERIMERYPTPASRRPSFSQRRTSPSSGGPRSSADSSSSSDSLAGDEPTEPLEMAPTPTRSRSPSPSRANLS